jgi:hypothetical protein
MNSSFQLATPAQKAVIRRARQLTDFCWTPIRDIPTYTKKDGNTVLPAGKPIRGFLYGSEEQNDKFFCENVSFETFLSTIQNPYGKIYQPGKGALNAPNYGIVCNGLARYALGIHRRVSTARWYTIPGMRMVKQRGRYTVEEIKLCDVLYAFGEGRNHVALLTDILRADSGEIDGIEVSEAVRPVCKRAIYSPDELYEKYALFGLWRYDYIDDVPCFDESEDDLLQNSGIEKTAPRLAVDNGNKSNYLEGEDVVLSAWTDGEDIIEVYRNGSLVEEIRFSKRAFLPRKFLRGYYVLRLTNARESVEFCVNKAVISHKVADGNITITVDSCDEKSQILYFDFRVEGKDFSALEKYEELTDNEKQSGNFTRLIPSGGKNYKVYFINKYGVWTQPMTPIFDK